MEIDNLYKSALEIKNFVLARIGLTTTRDFVFSGVEANLDQTGKSKKDRSLNVITLTQEDGSLFRQLSILEELGTRSLRIYASTVEFTKEREPADLKLVEMSLFPRKTNIIHQQVSSNMAMSNEETSAEDTIRELRPEETQKTLQDTLLYFAGLVTEQNTPNQEASPAMSKEPIDFIEARDRLKKKKGK